MAMATQLVEAGTALFNKGDLEGFSSLYSDDVVLTTPDGRFEGRDAVTSYFQAFRTMVPDMEATVGRHCEAGDTYFGEFTVRGTNTGPVPVPDGSTLPATQNPVHTVGTEIVAVEGGKIVQHDMMWDNLAFLGQLGVVPSG